MLISEKPGGEPVKVGELIEALQTLDPELDVCMCFGPDYDPYIMTEATAWPKHGCVFLLGEPDASADDEDDEDVIIGDYTVFPSEACEPEKETIDTDAAEEA